VPLCGCANFGGDALWVYRVAANMWHGEKGITLEEAAKVPYASVGMKLGTRTQTMLLLAFENNNQLFWTSASRIMIVTEGGRIVRTVGFGHDLARYSLQQAEKEGSPRIWIADFPELGVYSVPIACKRGDSNEEDITILGKVFHTLRTTEKCSAQSARVDWSFVNTFWKDAGDGYVWRSIQHVNPKQQPIELEILRPPA
jgi:hypothetical protein